MVVVFLLWRTNLLPFCASYMLIQVLSRHIPTSRQTLCATLASTTVSSWIYGGFAWILESGSTHTCRYKAWEVDPQIVDHRSPSCQTVFDPVSCATWTAPFNRWTTPSANKSANTTTSLTTCTVYPRTDAILSSPFPQSTGHPFKLFFWSTILA